MSNNSRLADMGVLHPKQIARYSVNSVGYVDYLRIIYDRPKGSLLPKTRNYEFPRVQKTVAAGSASKSGEVVMESSPELREALEELKQIVSAKAQTEDTVEEMLDELRRLEEGVAHHSACLRELTEKLRAAQNKLA